MNDEKAVATRDPAPSAPAVDLETLRAAVSRGGVTLDNSQLKLSIAYAERRGLDLISGQLIPAVMDGRLTFITTIDGLRVIAERSGQYAGQGSPVYGPDCGCGTGPHPEWAEVPIYRKGWAMPMVRRAYWHEYKPSGRTFAWDKMPHVMIAKVSEAAGLRAAFPNDMSGLYTGDEMEQAGHEPAPDRSEGPRQVAATLPPAPSAMPDIPDDAPDPAWAPFVGVVMERPDGVRAVKTPEWATGVTGSHTEKLELKTKIKNRKHTAIMLGDLAGQVANHPAITEGARVALDGDYHEYEWAEGKPKAKQLRNVTRVAVEVDGAWRLVGNDEDVVEGVAVEVEDAPPPPDPAPAAGETTPTSGDVTAQAAAMFDDMLDADVDPGRGGNPQLGDKWDELPMMAGANESPVELTAWYAKGGFSTTAGGKEMFDGWLTSQDMSQRIHVVMSKAWAEGAGVMRLGAGEEVYVRGVWRHPAGQPVILAEMVRPA